jgi:hypothetical protein
VFVDSDVDFGRVKADAISEAQQRARATVVCVSVRSVQSPHLLTEVNVGAVRVNEFETAGQRIQ